jgi:outer membrane lipoprotein-sorting protein
VTELIVNLEVHDSNESIRKIRLTDIHLNMELSDEEFRFVPPEGTRVIIR